MSLNYIETIIKKFKVPDGKISFDSICEGKIHSTYRVMVNSEKTVSLFILQKINSEVFKNIDALMHNFYIVSTHLKNNHIKTIEVVKTRNGKLFYNNKKEGSFWRMTVFISEGKSSYYAKNDKYAYEAGILLASFQKTLISLPNNILKENIKEFHNLKFYLKNLMKLLLTKKNISSDILNIIELVKEKANLLIAFEKSADLKKIKKHICHYDPKFSNMLFDSNGKGLCLIDLDTVQKGFYYYDFGDAVRSICRKNVNCKGYKFNFVYFNAFSNGYLSIMKDCFLENELKYLFFGVKVIALELSIRYLIDYFSDEKCFLINNNHDVLEHAKKQLFWLSDAEFFEEKSLKTLLLIYKNHSSILK